MEKGPGYKMPFLEPQPQRTIRPLRGQCLLLLLPRIKETQSGIALPDISFDRAKGEKERPATARVISVGPWKKAKNGFSLLPEIKPGDEVLIGFYSGQKLDFDVSGKLRLVKTDEVLAIVQN